MKKLAVSARWFGALVGLSVLLGAVAPETVLAAAPTIREFSPTRGPLGTQVTIYGAGLNNARAVKFNGIKAPIRSSASALIIVVVPAGASTGYITVKTHHGTATSSIKFTVTIGILPSTSTAHPKQKIYISGSGFTPDNRVNLYFDRTLFATVATSRKGTFMNAPLTIPQSAQPGQHPLTAFDNASNTGVSHALLLFTDWPQFRNNPAHIAQNAFENTITASNVASLAVAWSGATGGGVFSSPAVANGVVYVGSEDGSLYAFAASGCGSPTCAPLWTAATGGAIHSSPAVVLGVVYVGSDDGHLYAFAANGCGSSTCSKLWSSARPTRTGGAIESSPVAVNGRVFVGSMDGNLYAYNAAGCGPLKFVCAPVWYSANIVGSLFSSPAAANGVIYVGSEQGPLYAFAATGCGSLRCAPLWSGDSEGVDSSPAVANGVVYVGSNGDLIYGYAAGGCGAANCAPLAVDENIDEQPVRSSPAVANGVVYVGVDDGRLYAYDTNLYDYLWTSLVTGGAMFSSPAVAHGLVYVGSDDGKLYAFDADGCSSPPCSPVWSSSPTGGAVESSPAVANGVVYVGSDDGKLYAFTLNGN